MTQIETLPKERPILFSGPMVRAILSSRKTMTRRIVNPQPKEGESVDVCGYSKTGWAINGATGACHCSESVRNPYGWPGERLWVRETWAHTNDYDGQVLMDNRVAIYRADADILPSRWRPSIFMPRCFCRLELEITDVRVERLQEISGDDAKAEGADCRTDLAWNGTTDRPDFYTSGNIAGFRELWDKLNAKRGFSWDTNPWVWVVSFKRV